MTETNAAPIAPTATGDDAAQWHELLIEPFAALPCSCVIGAPHTLQEMLDHADVPEGVVTVALGAVRDAVDAAMAGASDSERAVEFERLKFPEGDTRLSDDDVARAALEAADAQRLAEEQRLAEDRRLAGRGRDEEADDARLAAAVNDARWVQQVFDAERPEHLTFLRFRPARELRDVADAARGLGLGQVVEIIDGAARLAVNHTGAPAPCPPGYRALEYPADEAAVAEVLGVAADGLRRPRLPGAHIGWRWEVGEVTVDVPARTVTATYRAVPPA